MAAELRRLATLARRRVALEDEWITALMNAHAAGWSLRTIAEASGLSHQTIANIARREADAGRYPDVRR